MMVDWITACAAAPNPGRRLFDTGRILRLSPSGEVEETRPDWRILSGSYDSRLALKSATGDDIWLSGNPVKFMQGHNLFGSADATAVYFGVGARVAEQSKIFPDPDQWQSWGLKGPRFTRIDLTRSYRFGSADHARAWLREVAANARSKHGGALLKHDSVYFGATSRRWALKAYHKGDEITDKKKGHLLPHDLPGREALIEWAQGVVRFEVTLRRPELETINLAAQTPLDLWSAYFQRIQFNRNCEMKTLVLNPHYDIEDDLPREIRTTVALWLDGRDVRLHRSPSTYYRHRRYLLDRLGIDINSPPATEVAKYQAELSSAGWDPEPLREHVWEPSHAYNCKEN